MEDNRKKLYIVVAIVSLAVAILSGTFAYFTASVTNNSVISGTIASLAIELNVTKVTTGDGLIPLREQYLSNAATASCIDNNGYTACHIYKLTLTNRGNVSVYVYGYITLTGNDTDNLKWTELSNATTYIDATTRGMARSSLVT